MRFLGRGLLANPRVVAFFALLTSGNPLARGGPSGMLGPLRPAVLNSPAGLARLELLGLDGVVPSAPGQTAR